MKAKPEFGAPKKLMGNFKKIGDAKPKALSVDASEFKPNAASEIKVGQQILHLKFGPGEVLSIDERNVATIRFSSAIDSPEKRIMLQYARLQILEG